MIELEFQTCDMRKYLIYCYNYQGIIKTLEESQFYYSSALEIPAILY